MDISSESIEITGDSILFFDFDGTLLNTDYANFLAYQEAVSTVLPGKQELVFNPRGRFTRDSLKVMFHDLSEKDYNYIIEEKRRCYSNYLNKVLLINRVVDILFKYSGTNRVILVTNADKDRVEITLNYFQLLDKFDNIFCNQGNGNKYQYAILYFEINPKNIIVFENEKCEIKKAFDAGVSSLVHIKSEEFCY